MGIDGKMGKYDCILPGLLLYLIADAIIYFLPASTAKRFLFSVLGQFVLITISIPVGIAIAIIFMILSGGVC